MFPVRNGISRGFHGRTNVANRSKLSSSFCEATVTLIPNPGEDITEKESYRPISLRNQDIKIRSKILANCIQQHIERIICHDLMEFKPEIQSWFYMQKSINIIHYINKIKDTNHNISADGDKSI